MERGLLERSTNNLFTSCLCWGATVPNAKPLDLAMVAPQAEWTDSVLDVSLSRASCFSRHSGRHWSVKLPTEHLEIHDELFAPFPNYFKFCQFPCFKPKYVDSFLIKGCHCESYHLVSHFVQCVRVFQGVTLHLSAILTIPEVHFH